jgi:hypothetical protein
MELRKIMAEFWQTNTLGQKEQVISDALDEAKMPHRGDAVEAWLKKTRDEYKNEDGTEHPYYWPLDTLLDNYRLHADTGTPLNEEVNEH